MRGTIGAGVAALAMMAIPATAAMTVGTFVTKASALRANPLAAFASPDFSLLRSEAQAATAQLKAEREARKAAGKPPIACVPPGQSIGITDMMSFSSTSVTSIGSPNNRWMGPRGGESHIAALPARDRALPLKDGYARVIAQRFPCH